ncbi:hypothetical protein E1A91_A11G324100v1 [Gossypium mustelinum]|uniref:Uncharacterized protein n=3 Tax=Gossypium TaxID=3633 RepID=A0A5J5TVL6_GOSBA|nr:hypothetical protein ES319_A11G317100v1 [Gossypium barbadense]TYG96377.1 hypothetical protein ES288_A11G345300v1 [Gossypium darwinii]TYJ12081.1 hypothetical protein E1A91_A11G324100v1 [Gossypium mustelinum]
MLDHLLLEDDEVSQSLSLNIRSSQKTRKPFKNGEKGSLEVDEFQFGATWLTWAYVSQH